MNNLYLTYVSDFNRKVNAQRTYLRDEIFHRDHLAHLAQHSYKNFVLIIKVYRTIGCCNLVFWLERTITGREHAGSGIL